MQYVTLLGLSLFLGFAFEQFQSADIPVKTGGIRTFPILALVGAALYALEPHLCLAFIAGLLVLGAWLFKSDSGLLSKATGVLAYLLGPITLSQPLWLAIGITVVAVLLVGSRARLHALTTAVPEAEIQTLAQFLLLVGVVLPLLNNQPAIPFTNITPFKVWLAVVAVSTMSYGSYLLQRYVFPKSGIVLTAILGGLYSSTATTVVLARRARDEGYSGEICGGMIAATSMMYFRILVVVTIFNRDLATRLLIPMLALGVVGLVVAFVLARTRSNVVSDRTHQAENPLQLGTALVFASLLIVISVVSQWVQVTLGSAGVLALAAVVGITDIDPFVISLAQNGATIALGTAAAAIMIASSSNNLLKAVYAAAFSRRREAMLPGGVLLSLSALGLIAAWMLR